MKRVEWIKHKILVDWVEDLQFHHISYIFISYFSMKLTYLVFQNLLLF